LSVAAYTGSFGTAQAERLLSRAGIGPRKGEADALARLGLDGALGLDRMVVHTQFGFALGWAIVELRNEGAEAHDLQMRRVGGKRLYVWPLVQPGHTADREVELLGTYRLTCGVAHHSQLGLVATLRVR
jgi:hypothetical protein